MCVQLENSGRSLTSITVREGLFLYEHNVSPYDGGIFHQAPLLLALFSAIGASRTTTNLFYIILYILNARALIDLPVVHEGAVKHHQGPSSPAFPCKERLYCMEGV